LDLHYPADMTRSQPLEPIPLRPDPGTLRERNVKSLVRACIASARSKTIEAGFLDSDIVKKTWPHDDIPGLIVRASTSPMTITSASALAQTVVVDLIAATAPHRPVQRYSTRVYNLRRTEP
jgi:hypothetical protein